jgi:hypothetical protein
MHVAGLPLQQEVLAMVNTMTEQMAPTAAHKSEAKVSGLAGVFVRLVQEHAELTASLLELRLSSDTALREALFPKVRDALLCHERAEARVVYAAMSKKEQTRLLATKHRRTAGELETLVELLSALDYSSAVWEPAFARLFDAFEQHTIEEESYNFPIAQRVLGEAKAVALIDLYDAARTSDDAHAEPHGSDEFSYTRDAVRAAIETRRGRARSRSQ